MPSLALAPQNWPAWLPEPLTALLQAHGLPMLIMALLGVVLVGLFSFHSAEPIGPPLPARGETLPPDLAADGGLAVLVVDDSAAVRTQLLQLLRGAGHQAVAVSDGAQALAALSSAHFSVMVTDLEMPNMNGLELLAAVRADAISHDLPVIAITGHKAMQSRVQDLAGLHGIFTKPWNDEELLRRVRAVAGVGQRGLLPTVAKQAAALTPREDALAGH